MSILIASCILIFVFLILASLSVKVLGIRLGMNAFGERRLYVQGYNAFGEECLGHNAQGNTVWRTPSGEIVFR